MTKNPESGSYASVMVTVADFANLSLLEPYAPLQRLLESAEVVASDLRARHLRRQAAECRACQTAPSQDSPHYAPSVSGSPDSGVNRLRDDEHVHQAAFPPGSRVTMA